MQLHGNLPRIGSYAEAESYFNRTEARTGRSYKIRSEGSGKGNTYTVTGEWGENERPLNTSNPYLGYTRMIRDDSGGSFRMRYHDTDVITYHESGEVTVRPWESMSTDTFYRALGPTNTYSHFASSPSEMLMLYGVTKPANEYGWRSKGKLYQIDGSARLMPDESGGWVIDETDTISFDWPTYHPDRAKRLKEFDLKGLRDFLTMTLHHLESQRFNPVHHDPQIEGGIMPLLADKTRWIEIAQNWAWLWQKAYTYPRRGRGRELPHDIESRIERFMRSLRNKLMRELEIVTIEQRLYLTSHGQATAMNQLTNKYSTGNL